jgi:anaerobic magnesium-protoporphyrin IX monomethyl ester cyclase
MKVLLVNPPYLPEERYGNLAAFGPTNEPLGLAYIAGSLEAAGVEVKIADAPALRMSVEEIGQWIARDRFDLVGVTMLTPMYHRSLEVLRQARRVSPATRTVVGGPHPTVLPEQTLEEIPELDFAVIGEGETTSMELVEALEGKREFDSVAGLAFRKNGRIVANPLRPPMRNLDQLPPPARHLLPMDAYRMTRSRTQAEHSYTVSVARGCPFRCAYCFRTFGRTFRPHSPSRIIQEISLLVDQYRAKEINLEADTITLNRSFILDLCRALGESGLSRKVQWTCESRVDTVDEEVLRAMKEAGCWQISYGVESGSQRLLDLIEKGITLEQVEKTFALTKRLGITIRAFFMLGLPTETREESWQTIRFARKLNAQWSQFTITVPFPGTKLYELARAEGALRSARWGDFKTYGGWTEGELVYVPKGRAAAELKALQKEAIKSFYLRPAVFWRFLKSIRSYEQFRQAARGFLTLVRTRTG